MTGILYNILVLQILLERTHKIAKSVHNLECSENLILLRLR